MQYFKDANQNTYLINSADEMGSLPAGAVPITVDEFLSILDSCQVTEQAVPQVVTRFQARAALHLAGLLTTVESLMTDPQTDMLARLAWQDAQEFRRQSPTMLSMAATLGLTDAQLDALFTTAAGIEA